MKPAAPPDRAVAGALAIMAASGFAGLGCQIVWTQQSALWLGHETAAVLAVVAAFFGGLATGALALGRRIEASARPARWYAGCEALIALWTAALLLLMRPYGEAALALIGLQPTPAWQWFVAFAGSFVLLLPATAAMGATLPAMARVCNDWRAQGRGHAVAALYAANTGGAVLGVLAAAFWLVPQWGLARTAALCIALNLGCAVAALFVFRAEPAQSGVPVAAPPMTAPARALLARLAATGLLGIGYEVLVVRVLGQVCEDTVYTYALLLAVYLLGSAAGAAALQRCRHAAWLDTDRLLAGLACACLAGTASLWAAEGLRTQWIEAWAGQGDNALAVAVSAEAVLALAAFSLPTFAMGALFSHLARSAELAGIGVARALAANTLGAAAAPLLFGVLLAPALGPKAALLLVAAGYLLLLDGRRWLRLRSAAPGVAVAAAIAALALLAPPLAFVDVPAGGRILRYDEGAMAAVSVVEDAQGVARLRIDNRQQEGSSATRLFDARQALLPLLLHPAPRRALFLGLGTGVTAAAAAEQAGLQVDAVELLPEVIAAAALFTPDTRAHTLAADARRYVRAGTAPYDVVVSDNFHPARSGSGALYTVEHFQAVRARLTPGSGVFCQWLPLHQMDIGTLRSIVQGFVAAFPGAHAMLATNSLRTPTLGLVGRADDGGYALPMLLARMAAANDPAGQAQASALGLDDAFAVFGSFVAGPAALLRFAGTAPANTDDRPVVAYRAPRITYAPDSEPAERLLALLHELTIAPGELLSGPVDPAWQARLAAYWQARDRYLESGRTVQRSADVRQMLAQVREPLLAVLRTSPDFKPAYEPLLRMSNALAAQDPQAAQELRLAIDGVRSIPAQQPAP